MISSWTKILEEEYAYTVDWPTESACRKRRCRGPLCAGKRCRACADDAIVQSRPGFGSYVLRRPRSELDSVFVLPLESGLRMSQKRFLARFRIRSEKGLFQGRLGRRAGALTEGYCGRWMRLNLEMEGKKNLSRQIKKPPRG